MTKKTPPKRKKWYHLSDKTCDRLEDGTKAVLVAILITAGGSTVTYLKEQFSQNKQIIADSRKEALATARKITNKLNDRYLYTLRVTAAFNWGVDQEKRYGEYDEAVKRWNSELITDLVDMKRYFGDDARNSVYQIIGKFNKLHVKINEAHNAFRMNKPISPIKLEEVYSLDDIISRFAENLQLQLRNGKVDLAPVPPPDSSKEKMISN